MTIHSDYEEIINTFGKVGPLSKLLLALFFFLTVSSLTSLADAIFGWKGFILTALGTYREYFVYPIVSLTKPLGLEYAPSEIHAAVLLSISVTVGMRLLSAGQVVAYKKINQRYGSNMVPNLTFFRIAGFLFPPSLWCWYGFSSRPVNLWVVGVVFIFYPIFIVVPKSFMSKFWLENGYLEKEEFSYFKSYYSYVIAALLIVGILGAINAGLTKTA